MRVRCPFCFNAHEVNLPTLAGLTPQQAAVLRFIHECLTKSGVAPTFDEIKARIGINSKSGVYRLISGLEERGAIVRFHYRARAIEITDEAKAMLERAAA